MTFDDGPTTGNTQKILDILAKHNVQASFFVIGQEVEKNSGLLEKIIASGHQIGNHSYTHQRMVLKTPGWVRDEVEKTDALIRAAEYTGVIHFRTPYGKRLFVTPWVLRSLGKLNIFFDVEPESYPESSKDTGSMIKYVLEKTHSGAIILLHPMYGEDNVALASLESIIVGLKERGFEFVTVDGLLERTGEKGNWWF